VRRAEIPGIRRGCRFAEVDGDRVATLAAQDDCRCRCPGDPSSPPSELATFSTRPKESIGDAGDCGPSPEAAVIFPLSPMTRLFPAAGLDRVAVPAATIRSDPVPVVMVSTRRRRCGETLHQVEVGTGWCGPGVVSRSAPGVVELPVVANDEVVAVAALIASPSWPARTMSLPTQGGDPCRFRAVAEGHRLRRARGHRDAGELGDQSVEAAVIFRSRRWTRCSLPALPVAKESAAG